MASCQYSPNQSNTWARALKVKEMAEQHMLWCIGNGNANFWYDKFMEFKLTNIVYPPSLIADLSVKDASQSSQWKQHLPIEVQITVSRKLQEIKCHHDLRDTCAWIANSSGKFQATSDALR